MKKEKPRQKEIFMNRVKCDCMAQKHQLINNCLHCGKVVCAQEGEGNCLYCGKLVTRPDGLFIDDSEQLFPTLPKEEQAKAALERSKAIQHKNKLVERDQSTSQNQNIFDQQMDYYEISENKWLDDGDRKKAVQKILQKQQYVEQQEFKFKIKYDAISGGFVREEFAFDQQAFKTQGQKFLQTKERQQKQNKQKQAKMKHNWDERVLRSEKLRDLCQQIIEKKHQEPAVVRERKAAVSKATELVLENED